MSNIETKKLIEYCLNILGRKSYSEFELRQKLCRKTQDEQAIVAVLKQIKDWKLIDDCEYAKGLVRSSLRFRPKGRNLLRFELSRRGIAKETVDKVLSDELPDDQSALISELIAKRLPRLVGLPREKRYQRLVAFLSRRGFDIDNIREEVAKTLD